MLNNLRNYILKSWFIALVLSVVVIISLPQIFDKYKIEVLDSGQLESKLNTRVYCHDLDHDGYSEKIYSFEWYGTHSLQVYTHDGGMVDQWNTHWPMLENSERIACGDYDQDGVDEVYTFFLRSDSVFIYCFEPMDTVSPLFIQDKFVCALTRQYNEPDASVRWCCLEDMNGDANGDLLFAINSGQARFPRNIFIYDIANDTVLKNKDFGSILNTDIEIHDLNGDGYKEIIGGQKAAGQIHDNLGIDYNDYSAWLMVYDYKLNLLFEPIEFPGFQSSLEVYPVNIDSKDYLLCYYHHTGILDNTPRLLLVNKDGRICREHVFPRSEKKPSRLLLDQCNSEPFFYICNSKGEIHTFNQELKKISTKNIDHNISEHNFYYDLDNDNRNEIILTTESGSLLITREDFSHPVEFKHSFKLHASIKTVNKNGSAKPSLLFFVGKEYIELEYRNNPLYYLRFVIYLGIYLAIWSFILMIRKLQMIQIRKQENIRNQIVDLQLKGFRNQMDPHFTFNVFNVMALKIREDSPDTYKAFMKFANLIRSTLESSDRITRSIDDELAYLENYLELEMTRFPDKLSYRIEIGEEVDRNMKIPKMILQTYVENSIKHGIRYKEGMGTVQVDIRKNRNALVFEVRDDGIGRKKAAEVSKNSTGYGLKIMENYFSLFNEYNVSKIKYEIIDLYDDHNNATGTMVKISIPLNFSYKLKKHGNR